MINTSPAPFISMGLTWYLFYRESTEQLPSLLLRKIPIQYMITRSACTHSSSLPSKCNYNTILISAPTKSTKIQKNYTEMPLHSNAEQWSHSITILGRSSVTFLCKLCLDRHAVLSAACSRRSGFVSEEINLSTETRVHIEDEFQLFNKSIFMG